MTTLKLTAIGTSTGAVIPKEMLTRLKVAKGDALYAIETPDGYLLTRFDPRINDQLEAGWDFMKQYRDTFKALAHWQNDQGGPMTIATLLQHMLQAAEKIA